MNLDDQQKKIVTAWIADGLTLADIQKRLASDLKVSMTYMEVRLLVDDLKLIPKDPAPTIDKTVPDTATEPDPSGAAPPTEGAQGQTIAPDSGSQGGPGEVSVTLDTVTRPGSMVSGNVSFSDGQTAAWNLGHFGRLGLAPQQQGYKPSAPDLQAFQQALERELGKMGF